MGNESDRGISRRGFLKGTGLTVAAAGLLKTADEANADAVRAPLGPGAVRVALDVNGEKRAVMVEPRATLAEVLRGELGLTGTKIVCDRGACSACTVHLDGVPVCACLTLAVDVGARRVSTIEGLERGGVLHAVQQKFIEHDAMQCGFCTPGMVMSCAGLLQRNPKPSADDVKQAVSGNLCRCGTYPKVIAATLDAAGQPLPPGTQLGHAPEPLETPPYNPSEGEPPPWPRNEELAVVGKPTPRLDGRAKVTGRARYTADLRLPGMLFARRVASPHAHAKVKAVDTSLAERVPGVKAVYVVEHNREGAHLRGGDGGRFPTVRYAGQTICALVATSQTIADEAAALVRVDYEPLPFTVELDEAMRDGAPLVYAGPTEQGGSAGGGGAKGGLAQRGNVRGPNESKHGDVRAGFKQAEVIVAGEFRTQVQTHSALETHGVVADWKPDGLTVYASTQGTATVREELAEVFGLDRAKVRVVTEFMGGGFGAKFGAGTYGVVATHLSKQAGAPVRLMLDRKEEHTSVGNRPATLQRLRIGAKKDGTLTAVELEAWGTAGAGLGAGVGPWAERIYPAPNFRSAQYDVFTHATPGCAFRAPGAPQSAFAVEQLVDELAEKLGMDPLLLRERLDRGLHGEDDASDRAARRRERKLGADKVGWSRRHAPGTGLNDRGPVKRGLGMAQAIWGRFVDLNSACEVRVHKDGSVELLSSVQDIGTGTRTALAQVVAEELGLRPGQITVRIGDTAHPIGPASGGSKTLLAITAPARTAAFRVRRMLLDAAGANAKSLTWKQLCARMRTDQITAQASRMPDYGGDPHDRYGGVQFAEVAVDVETGVIKVERVVAVHDCGRVINPLAVHSQVNGGILHGLSWALYEDRLLDRATGRMVNPNLEQYKIAGVRETPTIEVILVDQYQGRTATDANGIGEPANIATAAAIANAVYNAIGVRVRELPMRPSTVLAALERGGRR